MHGLIGAALVAGCGFSLWLVRARGGEVVPLLRGDTAQMGFMMSWIAALIVGVSMTLEHFAR
jgi:hypothetical protein